MDEWKEVFLRVFELSKRNFDDVKPFLYNLSILFAVLSTVIIGISIFELQGQGATFMQSLNPQIDNVFIVPDYIYYLTKGFDIFSSLLFSIMSVFLFFKITGKNKSFSESISYFFGKFFLLLFTLILFIILIIPLYILLFIPGIIFSTLWMFWMYAVLFRDKKFMSALTYSKSIVTGKKMLVWNNFVSFGLNNFMYWLLPGLLIFVVVFFNNTYLYLLISVFSNVFFNVFSFYGIIFGLNLFLDMEKNAGFKNELSSSSIVSDSNMTDDESNAKGYIEQYKSQFPRDSIKTSLVNSGVPSSDVDKYLKKYF